MRLSTGAIAALPLLCALTGAVAAAPSGRPNFNGTWSVRLVTEAGTCDRSYAYAVAIQDGRARLVPGPGDASPTISGQVQQDGTVALTLQHSLATGRVSGRLQANAGSGNWQVDLLGCTGRWTAEKRVTTAAY